tara:strand:- start:5282 stop:5599 length:318 start_codon:yes stop_codon:yes gene_type:complete
MARNTLAGKRTGQSKSARYYAANPEARKKKAEYDKRYNKKRSAVKKRVEANAFNRKNGTYGNKDGLDASHKSGGKGFRGMEKASKNRARNGKNSTVRKRKRTTKK